MCASRISIGIESQESMDISHRPTGFTQGNTLAETSLAAETSPQTSLMPEAQAGQTNRLKFSQDDS